MNSWSLWVVDLGESGRDALAGFGVDRFVLYLTIGVFLASESSRQFGPRALLPF